MTREEFIEALDRRGYSYEMEGDNIVITHNGNLNLFPLKTLLPGVRFENEWNAYLNSLETIPPGVGFKNGGDVFLNSLKTLPRGVVFENESCVYLESLKTLPPSVEFKNGGYVNLESLVGGRFDEWEGNIGGIDYKRLLNKMIELGLFDRR